MGREIDLGLERHQRHITNASPAAQKKLRPRPQAVEECVKRKWAISFHCGRTGVGPAPLESTGREVEQHVTFPGVTRSQSHVNSYQCLLRTRTLFGKTDLSEVFVAGGGGDGGVKADLRPHSGVLLLFATIYHFQTPHNQVRMNPTQAQRHPPPQ
jgi:hypothetical protein